MGWLNGKHKEDPGKQHSAELKSTCRVYKTETKRNRRPLWWAEGREQGRVVRDEVPDRQGPDHDARAGHWVVVFHVRGSHCGVLSRNMM